MHTTGALSMGLDGRPLTVELVVDDPRDLALLGAVESARSSRAHRSGTRCAALGQTEEIALEEHGGRTDNRRWE